MIEGTPSFHWTQPKVLAAELLAEDLFSDHEIAAQCHVARSTLSTWKADATFQARVVELVKDYARELAAHRWEPRRIICESCGRNVHPWEKWTEQDQLADQTTTKTIPISR